MTTSGQIVLPEVAEKMVCKARIDARPADVGGLLLTHTNCSRKTEVGRTGFRVVVRCTDTGERRLWCQGCGRWVAKLPITFDAVMDPNW